MVSNRASQVDDVAFGCVSFPGQRFAIGGGDCIAHFGIDFGFIAGIGEEILFQIVWEERSQHEPFSDVFAINGDGRNIVLGECAAGEDECKENYQIEEKS